MARATDGTDRRSDDARRFAENRTMSIEDIRESYAEYADRMGRLDRIDRLLTGRFRRAQFGDVDGRVLDVACGTGTNFPYLPSTVDLIGVDISPDVLAKARDRLDRLDVDGTVHEMDAQDLEFPDDYFDAVISALSTCTFPDPVVALWEMSRVCKPDGRILLFEHGRSDVGPVARFQDWRAESHYAKAGCRWNQEPVELVRTAGLPIREVDASAFGIITTIEAIPESELNER